MGWQRLEDLVYGARRGYNPEDVGSTPLIFDQKENRLKTLSMKNVRKMILNCWSQGNDIRP